MAGPFRPGATRSALALAFALPLALGGCGRGEEPVMDNGSAMNASEAAQALDEAMNAQDGALPEDGVASGELVPPAPGEEGGLPDDRAPLDEGAARNPTSVAASGVSS